MKKKNTPQSSIGKYFAQLKEKEQEVTKEVGLKKTEHKKKKPKK